MYYGDEYLRNSFSEIKVHRRLLVDSESDLSFASRKSVSKSQTINAKGLKAQSINHRLAIECQNAHELTGPCVTKRKMDVGKEINA